MTTSQLKRLFFVAVCSTGLLFTSCKKEEPTPTNPTPTTPTTPTVTEPFYVKVNGSEFLEDDILGTVSSWSQTLSIEASRNGGAEFVRLKMSKSIAAGTYSFADPDAGFMAAYYDDGNSIYGAPSGTGSLVIVSNTLPAIGTPGEIKGTFSFTASPYSFSTGSDSYTLTEGEFIVTYQ